MTAFERVVVHLARVAAKKNALLWDEAMAGDSAAVAHVYWESGADREDPREEKRHRSTRLERSPAEGCADVVAAPRTYLDAVVAAREEPPPHALGCHDAIHPKVGAIRVSSQMQDVALSQVTFDFDANRTTTSAITTFIDAIAEKEDAPQDDKGETEEADYEAEEAPAMAGDSAAVAGASAYEADQGGAGPATKESFDTKQRITLQWQAMPQPSQSMPQTRPMR